MRSLVAFSLVLIIGWMTIGCAQEVCPGYSNTSKVPMKGIASRSARIKPKESLILPHKLGGRRPPKPIY
jgi:hypothetical protein